MDHLHDTSGSILIGVAAFVSGGVPCVEVTSELNKRFEFAQVCGEFAQF